jgi:hypothetical protein
MRLSTTLPLLLLLPYTTQALTYWLHSSCQPGKPIQPPTNINNTGEKRWEVLFNELKETGKSARTRLMNSDRDPDYTHAFNTIFKNTNRNLHAPID